MRIPVFWDLWLCCWITLLLKVMKHPATRRHVPENQNPRLYGCESFKTRILQIISCFTRIFQHWGNIFLVENNVYGKITFNWTLPQDIQYYAHVLATLQVRDTEQFDTAKARLVSKCLHAIYCGRFRNLQLDGYLRQQLVSIIERLAFI